MSYVNDKQNQPVLDREDIGGVIVSINKYAKVTREEILSTSEVELRVAA